MKIVYLFYFICLLQADVLAQDNSNKDRLAAARQKLENIAKTVTEANVKHFGFPSMNDLRNAVIADPYEVTMIQLDKLRSYSRNNDPASLITHMATYIFPVVNSQTGEVISTFTVFRSGSQWSVVSVGRDKQVTKSAYVQSGGKTGQFSITTIPGLNLNFVTYPSNGSLMMVPVNDDLPNEINAGKPLPINRILEIYSAVARKYNGLPG